jgi:hypothetical protein
MYIVQLNIIFVLLIFAAVIGTISTTHDKSLFFIIAEAEDGEGGDDRG